MKHLDPLCEYHPDAAALLSNDPCPQCCGEGEVGEVTPRPLALIKEVNRLRAALVEIRDGYFSSDVSVRIAAAALSTTEREEGEGT